MSTRRDEVVAKAEEYIHKTWNLTILNQVGRGSSGIVFLAVDGSGIKHAVKIMWKNEFIVEYQERELAIYKTLNHKNIVQFYNGISLPDCVIIEMEYCEIDLDIYVKKQGGFLSLRQFRSLARQMNAAVHYLHSQGIAHRDIKPANVWLKILDDGEFVAKLGNFSFAKKEDDGLDTVLGTPLFEAPEVIRCRQNRNYTIKCDIWSLGVMYYNLLTGEFPFEFSHSYQGVRRAVCRSQLVPFAFPDHVNVPDCCGDFIWKHLFREPDLRFSAEEALSHPFLLNDIGDIIQVASPLGTSNCVKPLVCDIGVGDIVFDKARRVMGDTIREPHVSISGSLSTPITWGDIAHVFHFDDKEILDDICIISDGSIFTSDDVIPCERFGSITALFISGKKGVVANCIEADHHSCIDEEELHKIQSLDSSSFACLESYCSFFSQYFKECSLMTKMNKRIYENCGLLEFIRDNVMDFDRLSKVILSLQLQLMKKFKDFPIVSFVPPVMEQPRKTVWKLCDSRGFKDAKERINSLKDAGVVKSSQGTTDLSEEVASCAEIVDKSKEFERRLQNDLDEAYESITYVIKTLHPKAEALGCLFQCIKVLKKALQLEDPRAVYPELRNLLLSSDYFVMSSEDQSILVQSCESGSAPSPPS